MSAAAEATRGHKREAGRLRRSKHNKANRWAITPNFYFQAITDDEELRGLRPHPEPSRGGVKASRRQENVLVSCSSPGVVLDFIRTRSTRRTQGSAPTCFSQYSREPSGFQGQPKPAQKFKVAFCARRKCRGGSRGRSLLACRRRRKSENAFTSSGKSERKQTSSR